MTAPAPRPKIVPAGRDGGHDAVQFLTPAPQRPRQTRADRSEQHDPKPKPSWADRAPKAHPDTDKDHRRHRSVVGRLAELDYPMFIVTTVGPRAGERAGCLIGFASQCGIEPDRFVVWLQDQHGTAGVLGRPPTVGVAHPDVIDDRPAGVTHAAVN